MEVIQRKDGCHHWSHHQDSLQNPGEFIPKPFFLQVPNIDIKGYKLPQDN